MVWGTAILSFPTVIELQGDQMRELVLVTLLWLLLLLVLLDDRTQVFVDVCTVDPILLLLDLEGRRSLFLEDHSVVKRAEFLFFLFGAEAVVLHGQVIQIDSASGVVDLPSLVGLHASFGNLWKIEFEPLNVLVAEFAPKQVLLILTQNAFGELRDFLQILNVVGLRDLEMGLVVLHGVFLLDLFESWVDFEF